MSQIAYVDVDASELPPKGRDIRTKQETERQRRQNRTKIKLQTLEPESLSAMPKMQHSPMMHKVAAAVSMGAVTVSPRAQDQARGMAQ